MAEKREKVPVYTTPRGIARYPRLDKPDTKFNPDGDYKVDLVLPTESAEAKALMAKIDAGIAASFEQAKKEHKGKKVKMADAPYAVVTEKLKKGDEEEVVETDKTKFSFKLKAVGRNKKTGESWTMRPAVFDAKGQVLDVSKVKLGGGSEIKVAYEMRPYFMASTSSAGVSLRLKGVQVLKLVEWQSAKDASAFGFGQEEGYDGVGDEDGPADGGNNPPDETASATDGQEDF